MGIAQLILDQMGTAGKPKTSTSTTTSTGSQTQTQDEPMDLQSLGMLLALFLKNKTNLQASLGQTALPQGNDFSSLIGLAPNTMGGAEFPGASNPLGGLMNRNNVPSQQGEIAELFKSLMGGG